MIETALYVALGCAALSALAGSRTAWALVPAVGFTLWMQAEEIEFSRTLWIAIDLLAAGLIYGLNKRMGPVNWIVLALFPVAWILYSQPDPYRYLGTAAVTILQLLLAVRPKQIAAMPGLFVARWKANFQHRDEWTDLERRGQRGNNA